MRKTGAILAAAALVLPACGSANQDAIAASGLACPEGSECFDEVVPVGPGSDLAIESGDLYFLYEGVRSDQDDLTLSGVEGDLRVTLTNIGVGPHNLKIDETIAATDADKKVEAAGGATETGDLPLFAGTYVFYCDIPGHREAGMVGTIEILSALAAEAAGEAEPATDGSDTATDGAEAPAPTIDDLDDSDDPAAALDAEGLARLYQISFASGSAELADDATPVLQKLATYLTDNAAVRFRVEGNTDSAGDEAANQSLSEQRAQAVVDWLVAEGGIAADRLEAKGNGETNLIIENDETADQQAVNRRVEVFVIT